MVSKICSVLVSHTGADNRSYLPTVYHGQQKNNCSFDDDYLCIHLHEHVTRVKLVIQNSSTLTANSCHYRTLVRTSRLHTACYGMQWGPDLLQSKSPRASVNSRRQERFENNTVGHLNNGRDGMRRPTTCNNCQRSHS